MQAYKIKKSTGNNGFTLIELLVVIAVIGILSLGIPNFSQTIARGRLTTYANDFLTAINIARSEAIKRGVQVTVLRNGAVAGQWELGWTIFVDRDGTEGFVDDGDAILCEVDAGGVPLEDCLLKIYPALKTGYTLRTGGTTYQNYFAFASTGVSIVAAGDTFRLCDVSADNTNSRSITVNAIGRARVSTGTTGCP